MDHDEIKIIIFSPVKPDAFIADVYFNGERVHCGTGKDLTKGQAMLEAVQFIKFSDLHSRKSKTPLRLLAHTS
jgi:hypothetical protein